MTNQVDNTDIENNEVEENRPAVKSISRVVSFMLGATLNIIMIAIIIFAVKQIAPEHRVLLASIFLCLASLVYFGWQGLRKIEPVHVGVPLWLGDIIESKLLPAGWVWILPEPFMSLMSVSKKEQTFDSPIKRVLSFDNIEVEVDVQIQYVIEHPHKYVKIEEPVKALTGLVDRNVRWLANLIPLDKLPGVKILFSQMLEGNISVEDLILHDSTDTDKLKEEKGNLKTLGIIYESKEWGLKIKKAMVTDIRIPESIAMANAEKEVEEAQIFSETTQQKLFLSLLGGGFQPNDKEAVEAGKKVWESMDGKERAKILQGERGKRTIITVDGEAGDFTKGSVAAAKIGGSKK